jgi:hypothetical protein
LPTRRSNGNLDWMPEGEIEIESKAEIVRIMEANSDVKGE